jgi:hypothetical protein
MKNISSYFSKKNISVKKGSFVAFTVGECEDRRKACSEYGRAAHDDALRRRALGDRRVDPVMDFIDGICCDERPSDSAHRR